MTPVALGPQEETARTMAALSALVDQVESTTRAIRDEISRIEREGDS